MGVKKQIWPPRHHFLNRTENKWVYILALQSFRSIPSLKEIQLVLFELRLQVCLHPRWPPATILNDIKIYLTCIIPDIGVKVQTI